jgi:hypothetical protein
MRGLKIRYYAGDVVNGTAAGPGGLGDLYVRPPNVTTSVSLGWIPVLPADLQSVTGTSGFGETYINDVFKHYARVKYNRIVLSFVPYGLSMNTNSTTTLAMAPFRGPVAASSIAPGVGTAYTLTAATVANVGVVNVATSQGGVQFPSWEETRLDLTPYIANGSGPKQNEFPIYTTSSASIQALSVPCCWRLTGDCPASITTQQFWGTIYIDLDVDLLDWQAYLPIAVNAVGGEQKDFKAPPVGVGRPPALDFRSAVVRGEAAASPTHSLLGAALDSTYVEPVAARARSAAMPIPNAKR